MSDTITVKSVGRGIAEVDEDFVLQEEKMSRIVFRAKIHSRGIRGRIIRQRRESESDKWIPDKTIPIRSLEKNEGINIEMKTEAVKRLFEAIIKLSNILKQKGIEYGEHTYAVVNPENIIITDKNISGYIKKMIAAGYDEDLWEGLVESNPSLVTKLTNARLIADRQKILKEFKVSLDLSKDEGYWQDFFDKNQWIFGYGLNYKFLNKITSQPRYSGADYDGFGEKKGDYLLNTLAECKFTVLVEIKKPQTKLALNDKEYRRGVSNLNPELLWAISQMQINCDSWFREGSQKDKARDELENQGIYTFQPKGILVIGHTKQLDNRNKRQTFESFRSNLNNPEILTFDELFYRAKFIVDNCDAQK